MWRRDLLLSAAVSMWAMLVPVRAQLSYAALDGWLSYVTLNGLYQRYAADDKLESAQTYYEFCTQHGGFIKLGRAQTPAQTQPKSRCPNDTAEPSAHFAGAGAGAGASAGAGAGTSTGLFTRLRDMYRTMIQSFGWGRDRSVDTPESGKYPGVLVWNDLFCRLHM